MDETVNQRRGRRNKQRGKEVEREVAKLVGGERMPDTGKHWADVQTVGGVYEVKSRQAPTPALIAGAWEQATVAAAATEKVPHVVLSYVDKGKRTYWLVTKLEGV